MTENIEYQIDQLLESGVTEKQILAVLKKLTDKPQQILSGGNSEKIICNTDAIITVGDDGTVVTGNGGTAIAGDRGYARTGSGGTAKAGNYGIVEGEESSDISAGDYGSATALGEDVHAEVGDYGTVTLCHPNSCGKVGKKGTLRWVDKEWNILLECKVGQNGLKPNQWYTVARYAVKFIEY